MMYITAAQATRPEPVTWLGTENIRIRNTEFRRVPTRSQGLNFPHLVLVFATMTPMIGSLSASNILAQRRMIPM